jgi:putative transposase
MLEAKRRVQSWEMTDELWAIAEPLVPERQRNRKKKYKRKAGGGRKPLEPRQVFAGIVFVLRTGIRWKALPKAFGASSSVHAYFQEWRQAGFFKALWERGVQVYDEQQGIGWRWQAIDGAKIKAPIGKDGVGGNPTDRGKKRHGAASAGGCQGRALGHHAGRRQPP